MHLNTNLSHFFKLLAHSNKHNTNQTTLFTHSPHKFRHGHAVYSLKQSKDIADLKAVSQNLMHSNLSTTDGIYGVLSSADVGKRISGLGKKAEIGEVNQVELLNQLTQITELLKKNVGGSGTEKP